MLINVDEGDLEGLANTVFRTCHYSNLLTSGCMNCSICFVHR